MNKMCITVAEAAELASVPQAVIREWAQDFDFPSMKSVSVEVNALSTLIHLTLGLLNDARHE